MKISGIEFAPLWIPLEQRGQTLVICILYGIFGFGIICQCVGILLLFTRFYFVPLLYIAWHIYDSDSCIRGNRRWQWLRRWKVWDYARDYFPVRMVKTSELPPSKNYLMVCHPHGILCNSFQVCFGTEATNFSREFPGLTSRILMLNSLLRLPFQREYLLWTGSCLATKKTIDWLFTREEKGNALALIVGGAHESLDARPGSATLFLKSRKGFIKIALRHGASLVPVYAFGENEIFNQVPNPEGSYLRTLQNKCADLLGPTFPLFYGRGLFQYSFGFLPFRRPITVVIGKPIHLEVDPNPTNEKIYATHQQYIDSLTELFNEHKIKYGPNLELKIK